MILVSYQIMLLEQHTPPFPSLMMVNMPYLAKAGEPPNPSYLLGGAIITNHHVLKPKSDQDRQTDSRTEI